MSTKQYEPQATDVFVDDGDVTTDTKLRIERLQAAEFLEIEFTDEVDETEGFLEMEFTDWVSCC